MSLKLKLKRTISLAERRQEEKGILVAATNLQQLIFYSIHKSDNLL